MDLFPDGAFVLLESRVTGKYVHADGDWERVSLRPNGPVPSLNAVWRVEHWVSPDQGNTFVLLQNAAYGRYLSFSMRKAQTGHRGRRTTQMDRSEPNVLQNLNAYPWMWTVERLNPPDQDYVSLRYFTCYLRANGRYLPWNIRVTADVDPDAPRVTTMMHWTVHQVAASPVPQPLPLTLEDQGAPGGLLFPHPPRTIRHVRASDEGEFDQNHHNWPSFAFYDSSVTNLRYELVQLQHDLKWSEDMSAYTLCMLPGSHGRLMPLVTDDLPSSLDSMNIVVFRTESPGAAALVYPQIDAPAQ
ncbi:uncharacterized protein [Miscanthus floridulus]|uniref:uncharacterized protein n=1 Tax=Miscanthus floridulus TaxID=154761 RepID=UPI003459682A